VNEKIESPSDFSRRPGWKQINAVLPGHPVAEIFVDGGDFTVTMPRLNGTLCYSEDLKIEK